MLIKHRGLTLVGAFAMAVAIAVGATLFEVISEILDPTLPFAGGERIVSLRFVGADPGSPQRQVIHDFAALRGQLAAVEHFGAFRDAQHNLVAAETAPEPVSVAEITASAFAMTVTPASLGRYLLPADEPASAPPVVVIGHDAWQVRFGGDRNLVGRAINLDGVPRTVVGVIPNGFQFPVDHQFWIPLREDPLKYARGEGPQIYIFGRLAPGVTIDQAQAEFAAVAQRTAGLHPDNGLTLRVVHGGAAHARDWHPHRAGRAAGERDVACVRTRRVAGRGGRARRLDPVGRCVRGDRSRSCRARRHYSWRWRRSWGWSA